MQPRTILPPDRSIAGRLTYAAYDLAGVLACALCIPASPYLWWRGYGAGLKERLGVLPRSLLDLPAPPVWVHSASVGETLAAAPLVAEIKRQCPDMPIVASTTTLTGQEVARSELEPRAATLLPVDALRIVDRVLRTVQPRCLLLVETEIWPGLLRAANRIGCPVVMVSGRVSHRSERGYRWAGPLIRTALRSVSRFGMQTASDAQRIISLGAPKERVFVTGNLKGGRRAPSGNTPALAGLDDRPVLIAASTQPGEEEFVLAACEPLWKVEARLLLVIAPRRPERFGAVTDLVARSGLRYERRSAMHDRVAPETQVLILDTVGELLHLFSASSAVFVGGTIAPMGGHNVLEPAAYGKPVAFGPSTANVAGAAEELCRAGGAVRVRESLDLQRFWEQALIEPDKACEMGARAGGVVAEMHANVVERTWAIVEPYLGDTPGVPGGHWKSGVSG